MPANASYIDITLRNITVIDAVESIGVILGSPTNPMENVVFDGVVFENPPVDNYYVCENVASGAAKGNSTPVPYCFTNKHRV